MKGNKAKGTWDFQLWALFGPHASSNVRFADPDIAFSLATISRPASFRVEIGCRFGGFLDHFAIVKTAGSTENFPSGPFCRARLVRRAP